MTFEQHRVAFIGTGQMATALAAGFCRSLLPVGSISGCDPSPAARQHFQDVTGVVSGVSDSLAAAVSEATVICLSVKPQVMTAALNELRPLIQPAQLVVSIAAGIPLAALAAKLPAGTRLIRVMPNTPCLIGKGASALCRGDTATVEDEQLVVRLLETAGLVEVVPEHLMDAVTGLSGSGPAYVFRMIQALSDGGVRMGLPRKIATRLAAQTVAGAADLMIQRDEHPSVLCDAVTSPGGTTIAGLHALETGGFAAAVMNAVVAATQRSEELGQ